MSYATTYIHFCIILPTYATLQFAFDILKWICLKFQAILKICIWDNTNCM